MLLATQIRGAFIRHILYCRALADSREEPPCSRPALSALSPHEEVRCSKGPCNKKQIEGGGLPRLYVIVSPEWCVVGHSQPRIVRKGGYSPRGRRSVTRKTRISNASNLVQSCTWARLQGSWRKAVTRVRSRNGRTKCRRRQWAGCKKARDGVAASVIRCHPRAMAREARISSRCAERSRARVASLSLVARGPQKTLRHGTGQKREIWTLSGHALGLAHYKTRELR